MKRSASSGPVAARWSAVLLVCLWVLVGCEFKGGPRSRGEADGEVWRVEPVRMRVYPSSRFVHEQGLTLLEARVEMLDAMNDSTKSAGDFRFELLDSNRPAEAQTGERLYSWDVSLRTLADQRRHYDPITRTYLFRLRVDESLTPSRPTVMVATFSPIQGPRLRADTTLNPVP